MNDHFYTQSVSRSDETTELPNLLSPSDPVPQVSRQDEIAMLLKGCGASALVIAELVAEWVEIERTKVGQFDQRGLQKNEKGIAKAARVLLVPGRTEEGRRKFIERAVQIAAIPAKAKEAAIRAGLANRRMKLVDIAQAKTIEAALSEIEIFKAIKKIKAMNKKQPAQSAPAENANLNKYKEQVAAIEAGWQEATKLRSALDKAPLAVFAWFVKHCLSQYFLTEGTRQPAPDAEKCAPLRPSTLSPKLSQMPR
jgi:plasmid replication initiation protein